jgi:hypothetical protein
VKYNLKDKREKKRKKEKEKKGKKNVETRNDIQLVSSRELHGRPRVSFDVLFPSPSPHLLGMH